jgi:hypothetical protein
MPDRSAASLYASRAALLTEAFRLLQLVIDD